MPPKQKPELVYAFMAEVSALQRALHDVGEAVAATAGLTHTQLACLRAVADARQTVAATADGMGVARQGVQRTADGLVETGYATWTDNPRHRRAKLLGPSAKGRRALTTAATAHAQWVAQAGRRLPGDLADLTARLRSVREIAVPNEV